MLVVVGTVAGQKGRSDAVEGMRRALWTMFVVFILQVGYLQAAELMEAVPSSFLALEGKHLLNRDHDVY